MIHEHDNGYISPRISLLDFQQEGPLCLSDIKSDHDGYGNGGDINIDLNINE